MTEDYRDWLRKELRERSVANPRYSLRAFARDLKLSPASVSLILNGKKGLSKQSAERIGQRLGWAPRDQQLFKALVLKQHSRSKTDQIVARTMLAQYQLENNSRLLELDTFKVIGEWYHFAILQLTLVRGFRSDVAWIAKRVDIPEYEAREAVARLKRLGLLVDYGQGKLRASKTVTLTPSWSPSEALRKFHRMLGEKSVLSIQQQSMQERHHYSTILPIDPKRIPEIGARIAAFHDSLIQKFGDAKGNAEEVYGFCTGLFRITKPGREA